MRRPSARLFGWLVEPSAKTLMVRNMGANPFLILCQRSVTVYVTPKNRGPVAEIVGDLKRGKLAEVTPENMTNYLLPGQHRQEHVDDHRHGHGRGP